MVILPIVVGVLLNQYFNPLVKRIESYTPFLAVLSIVFIVNFILAAKKDAILEIGAPLIAAVVSITFFWILVRILFITHTKIFRKRCANNFH
ncbi:MAG: hypothetical protein Ct9H300mP23_04620 [Nitrospinota bacterium]|nr:MAG: hypothetical protein Ct9H300mP23_04620 [Nitrospinota bacterium]